MTNWLQRVENSIQNRKLISRGEKILAAVSGGLDSLALLHALKVLSAKQKWKIVIAHFNHKLRGRASDADEKLVCEVATKMELPIVVENADVKSFAKKSKLSIEMAARKLRHEFLARVAGKRRISNIALAHHADDQVELFFLRVLRGAGGAGLAGMKWRAPSPVNPKIMLVRPLLGFTKAELREFALEKGIKFREDATNRQLGAPRNRVRNELLPLLRENYQPGLTKIILRLMEIIGAESETVGQFAGDWLRRHHTDFEKLPVAVQRRILQSQLEKFGLLSDFDLIESLRQAPGIVVNVNVTCFIARDLDGVLNLHQHSPSPRFNQDELVVNLTGRAGEEEFGNVILKWRFGAGRKVVRPRTKSMCEFFDAAKVGRTLILRHWRPGDRFHPIGLKKSVKLQDLFINAKIPRDRRHGLIVATTADGEIFWVEGLRISEKFKLTKETKRKLIWCWRR